MNGSREAWAARSDACHDVAQDPYRPSRHELATAAYLAGAAYQSTRARPALAAKARTRAAEPRYSAGRRGRAPAAARTRSRRQP